MPVKAAATEAVQNERRGEEGEGPGGYNGGRPEHLVALVAQEGVEDRPELSDHLHRTAQGFAHCVRRGTVHNACGVPYRDRQALEQRRLEDRLVHQVPKARRDQVQRCKSPAAMQCSRPAVSEAAGGGAWHAVCMCTGVCVHVRVHVCRGTDGRVHLLAQSRAECVGAGLLNELITQLRREFLEDVGLVDRRLRA